MSGYLSDAAAGQNRFLPNDPLSEAAIYDTAGDLLARMVHAPAPALFSRKGVYGRLMEWSMRDPAFKAQLFRFVDVLPTLRSPTEVTRHLQEYLGDRAVALHPTLKLGMFAAKLAPSVVAKAVTSQVTSMAREFVAGTTGEDLKKRLAANSARGLATTIDMLGETVVSEAEADAFLARNIEILNLAAGTFADMPETSFSDRDSRGPLPRVNLSVKISALTPELNPADPAGSIEQLKVRLRPILRRASDVGALINFDMESYRLKDLTLALFRSILEEEEFSEKPAVGIAMQAYLRDTEKDLEALIAWARACRRFITVRLVKGAYWDYEYVTANQRSWPVPVWASKAETDINYEKLTRLLLDSRDAVAAAFATHNVRSCARAIVEAERLEIDPRDFEFQSLYGMADDLKFALLGAGYRVREYCPIGELLPGMAYLVRRLLENTSNESFLRAKNLGETTQRDLLSNPVDKLAATLIATQPAAQKFKNAANSDFSKAEPRAKLEAALGNVSARLPIDCPLVIDGQPIAENRETIASVNPSRPAEWVGRWIRATVFDAEAAVKAARRAQSNWQKRTQEERSAWLERVADLLESKRFTFAALEILEAGKPWAEADADISEAIDFCRYYAMVARELGHERTTQKVLGENTVELIQPRGVGVVIAPWNFPLAILCGMTVAGLVVGNAVVMKPAEQTSVVASAFMGVLSEAGLPPGVANLVLGFGEDVGAHLVEHAAVDYVAFTGSREVGLKIWEAAGRSQPGQRHLKHAICEMGGKNCLIVDADADWDEAIPAILYSAFGFAGQKCSALSRLIVHADIAEEFTARLVAAARSLRVGDPREAATVIGPVIDADAQNKILGLIERGNGEAKPIFHGTLPSGLTGSGGYFVAPTIFTGVTPKSFLAQTEIFGPVLAVMVAKDLDEAFAWANDTDYGLTAGIFSRSPSALERARRELVAGNVYLNRGITGAMVERHPFGGFKMSGGGTKAGGRAYLENFVVSRVISENTLRRGFTPPERGE